MKIIGLSFRNRMGDLGVFVFMVGILTIGSMPIYSAWGQQVIPKLPRSDGEAGDGFGTSLSISGDVALVGAGGSDDQGVNSGAAYIYRRNNSAWVEEQKLLASDGANYAGFGGSVSVSGDVALVAAPMAVNPENDYGVAYIYRRNNGAWVEEQKLWPPHDDSINYRNTTSYGRSVSISGDIALVGAWGDDDHGGDSGAVYIYRRSNDGTWIEEQKLYASDGEAFDLFGSSVSVNGQMALVGASNDDASTGAAYIYHRNNDGVWVEEQKLSASDRETRDSSGHPNFFGGKVSLSGDVALVGVWGDDEQGTDSGTAYIYHRNASGVWVEEQKLLAADGGAFNHFGRSVSISGDIALVGAKEDDNNAGTAYTYRQNADGVWVQEQKIMSPTPPPPPSEEEGMQTDAFGVSVSVSSTIALVGDPRPPHNVGQAGDVYVFNINPTPSIAIER